MGSGGGRRKRSESIVLDPDYRRPYVPCKQGFVLFFLASAYYVLKDFSHSSHSIGFLSWTDVFASSLKDGLECEQKKSQQDHLRTIVIPR